MAPETIVGTKLVNDTPPAVQMTRPFSVFPKVAKNRGSAAPALGRIVAARTGESCPNGLGGVFVPQLKTLSGTLGRGGPLGQRIPRIY